MDLTIPEAVLLLAIDDETGASLVDDSSLGVAVAAAAIAQLLLDGRMRVAGPGEPGATDGTLVAAAGGTDARLEPLVAEVDGRSPEDAISSIVGWSGAKAPGGRLRGRLLDDFAAAGVLVREQDRFLGMTWRERWERGERREVEDALAARAREVLAGEVPARADDARVATALAILHGAKALPKVFPDLPAEQLARRGDELATGTWASASVRSAIEAIEGAMVAIMVTTMIVPVITSS